MRRFPFGPVLLLVVMLASVFPVGQADAAAYAKWVSAPKLNDGRVVGVAEINTDCEGTFGCHAYIKIEYRTHDLPGYPWQYVDGGWADQGRNEVSVEPVSGCGYYRTVVDTYNDMPGDATIGVNIGVVEASLGGGIQRYHQMAEARSTRICHEPRGGSGGNGGSGEGGGGGGGGGWG